MKELPQSPSIIMLLFYSFTVDKPHPPSPHPHPVSFCEKQPEAIVLVRHIHREKSYEKQPEPIVLHISTEKRTLRNNLSP